MSEILRNSSSARVVSRVELRLMLNNFEDDDCVTWINQSEVAEIFHSWLIFKSPRDGVGKSRLEVLKTLPTNEPAMSK